MRIDKYLIEQLDLRKPERKKLFRQEKILVDGIPAKSLRQNIDASLQEIVVDGQRMTQSTQVYFMMNKARKCVTATFDHKHPTVIDFLLPQDQNKGIYPIGRLDFDTTGLLILTNNGPLSLQMLHPSHHVDKTYLVTVNGMIDETTQRRFKEGIVIDQNYQCKPANMTIIFASAEMSQAQVTISEGKFHQIKKMFLSAGVKVIELKRIKFANIELDPSLQEGQYRPLNEKELLTIKAYLQ